MNDESPSLERWQVALLVSLHHIDDWKIRTHQTSKKCVFINSEPSDQTRLPDLPYDHMWLVCVLGILLCFYFFYNNDWKQPICFLADYSRLGGPVSRKHFNIHFSPLNGYRINIPKAFFSRIERKAKMLQVLPALTYLDADSVASCCENKRFPITVGFLKWYHVAGWLFPWCI